MSINRRKQKSKQTNQKWIIALAAAALVVVGLTAILPSRGQADAVVSLPLDVSIDEASVLRDQGALMLDVRTQEEWDEVHIPGAVLIPLDQLAARLDEIPQYMEIVVYCRSGNRSLTGRDILLRGGFQDVTSMSGGINAWGSAGYPVETGP